MNHRLRRRGGVASIIGGLFLVLIIISAYAFFMMSNQATSDLQTTINNQSSLDDDKNQENLSFSYIVPTKVNDNLNGVVLTVVNSGPKTVTVNYIVTIDMLTGIYKFNETLGNPNINPGNIGSFNIPILSSTDTYIVKLITSKGSIFSFNYPSLITLNNSSPSISTTPTIQNGAVAYILSGSYFNQSRPRNITITSNGNPVDSYKNIPTPNGYFSIYLNQLQYGVYNVKVTNSKTSSVNTTLTITPYIVLSPNSLSSSPDLHFKVKGSGYPASSTIKTLFDNSLQITNSTDPSGMFTANLDVEGISSGSYVVTAQYYGTNPDFLSASNIFTVLP